MIKKIIILVLILSIKVYSAPGEIGISKCSVSETSTKEFLLSYDIKNSFDTESYSLNKITIPLEKYIIQGNIVNGLIQEKDFLFSHKNLDLNNNGNLNDSYKIKTVKKNLYIDNLFINPIIKTTASYNVLLPFDNSGKFNINKFDPNGIPFTLRDTSSLPEEITIGLNETDNIEFRTYDNNLLLIEIITPEKIDDKTLFPGDVATHTGFTNEKSITTGENFYRYTAAKKVLIDKNASKGELKIGRIQKPFSVRVTYYFSISENLIIMNQKILMVN
ncbi:MAG: hypothetical protein CVV49_10100 [Spirochaetae bacterium HGW-Spirochaetae-5]|nr:MAG: hypothetical protein CVV49_10100 [Spirochaetae bacterium HGW-Spirochaetae-5]